MAAERVVLATRRQLRVSQQDRCPRRYVFRVWYDAQALMHPARRRAAVDGHRPAIVLIPSRGRFRRYLTRERRLGGAEPQRRLAAAIGRSAGPVLDILHAATHVAVYPVQIENFSQ